jgi:protein TonB
LGAGLLFCGVALGVALLRYPLERPPDRAVAVVVSEIARPAPPPTREPVEIEDPAPESIGATAPPAAVAPPAIDADPVAISDPVWVDRPRNTERYYPRAAFRQGIEGRVVLDCLVEVDGRLTCEVMSETPQQQGFGDAALAIAAAHVMRPAMRDGTPVRGRYVMTIPFSTPG